jgi:type VI secretion system lysozyme-like protein
VVGPRVLAGSLPPLMERLIDLEPRNLVDRPDARRLRGGDTCASVMRGLAHLLDTRRHVTLDSAAQRGDLTVLDYGVPDLGNRSPADPEARFLLAQAILHAVRAFEPRLLNPAVQVSEVADRGRLLDVGSLSEPGAAADVLP